MVDLFPAIRLAQSILKRKFPFVDKPLKKGLWKIWAPGLISRILRYVGWSLWLLVGPLMPNRSKDDQTKCGPLVLRGGGIGGGGRAGGGGGEGGGGGGLRADTLSHKTLLLQKPKADKIHFIKGTLSPVLTGSEDRCS